MEDTNMETTVEAGAEDLGTETAETKTYSEAEVLELVQREADKRVSAALKKQEHKLTQKMAEADKLRNMDEDQRQAYEFEQKLAEFEAEKKEFEIGRNKLEAVKVLSNRGLPVEFVDYVATDNAETTMENIIVFEKLFKSAINDAVSVKIAAPTPKSGSTTQSGLTKEGFMKLPLAEQQELYRTNPELYRTLIG